jgi:hypothetical protein
MTFSHDLNEKSSFADGAGNRHIWLNKSFSRRIEAHHVQGISDLYRSAG